MEDQQYILRGADNAIRARLATNPDGSVFLTLHDPAGVPRVEFSVSALGEALVALASADRKARLVARVRGDGNAGIFLYDDAGQTLWRVVHPE